MIIATGNPAGLTLTNTIPPPLNFTSPRCIIFIYLFLIGFVFSWTGFPNGSISNTWSAPPRYSDDDDIPNMPVAYLTNWGFVSAMLYFMFAAFFSFRDYCCNKNEHDEANLPTTELGYKRSTETGGFVDLSAPLSHSLSSNRDKLSPLLPSSDNSPKLQHYIGWYFFNLAMTLQPFIVVGFWGLVFPYSKECDYQCGTVHGAACACMYIELIISKLKLDVKILPLVILYPSLWVVSQIIWIFTDHRPDYKVLPMDNISSYVLTAGSLVFFVGTFFFAKWVANKRDYKYSFPGGVSGRSGPPASYYFSNKNNGLAIQF